MKGLAFIDFQNTISFNGEPLSKITLDKIKEIEKNYYICLTSSAFKSDIEIYLKENNLNWDFIANGGAYLKVGNKIMRKTFHINQDKFSIHKDDLLFFFYEDSDVLYRYNFQERLANIYPKNSNTCDITDISIMPSEFEEIIVCLKKTIKESFLDQLNCDIKTIIEDNTISLIKLTPKNTNKSSFMNNVINYYNVDFNKTIAFGDSEEDLEMFKKVKIKVAVENAIPPLKIEADYQVLNYKAEGVFNFLLLFDDPSTL